MRVLLPIAMALAICASPAIARKERAKPPIPPGYEDAGPAPEDVLPKIVSALRTTLTDPSSIRDFTLCDPKPIEAYYGVDWVRAHWVVNLTLNSKNRFGGYVGSTMYTATFESGEVTKVNQFTGLSLVSAEVNGRLVAMARSCPRVPDSEIQRLLAE